MDEKKCSICSICDIVGYVALLVSLILLVTGSYPYLLTIILLFLGIAAVAFAIRLGIEISSEETCIISVLSLAWCLFNIALTAIQLV